MQMPFVPKTKFAVLDLDLNIFNGGEGAGAVADPGLSQGAPTPGGGAEIQFYWIFPKTAWNWGAP